MDAKQPAWKGRQQEEINAKPQEARANATKEEAPRIVKIKMLSDYRDEVRRGDVYETDPQKAEELVKLKRAEYIGKKRR